MRSPSVPLKTACAWCSDESDENVSHGLCEPCRASLLSGGEEIRPYTFDQFVRDGWRHLKHQLREWRVEWLASRVLKGGRRAIR